MHIKYDHDFSVRWILSFVERWILDIMGHNMSRYNMSLGIMGPLLNPSVPYGLDVTGGA